MNRTDRVLPTALASSRHSRIWHSRVSRREAFCLNYEHEDALATLRRYESALRARERTYRAADGLSPRSCPWEGCSSRCAAHLKQPFRFASARSASRGWMTPVS
jgi:hypothetical protein